MREAMQRSLQLGWPMMREQDCDKEPGLDGKSQKIV